MSKRPFKINDRVIMIERGELYKGTIQSVYEMLSTAVVKFDNGEYLKVSFNRLAHEPETKEAETKEPEENKTVTVTYKEFRDLCVKIAMRMGGGGEKSDTYKLVAYGAYLAKELFCKENND